MKVGRNPGDNARIIRAVQIEQYSAGLVSQTAKIVGGITRTEGVRILDDVYNGTAPLNLLQCSLEAVGAAGAD